MIIIKVMSGNWSLMIGYDNNHYEIITNDDNDNDGDFGVKANNYVDYLKK